MIKYFRELREMRKLKRTVKKNKLLLQSLLLKNAFSFIVSFPNIIKLANDIKDMDVDESGKIIIERLVDIIKSNEVKNSKSGE